MKKILQAILSIYSLVFLFLFPIQVKAQSWSEAGSGIGSGASDSSSYVTSLTTDSSRLYAGGFFSIAGGNSNCYNIAAWDGTSWSQLGSGIGTGKNDTTSIVFSVLADNNKVYAAGSFSFANGSSASNIAQWDGSSWSGLSSGIGGESGSYISSLAADSDNNIYAAGYFNTAGGNTAYNIAEWNGTTWLAMGEGIGKGSTDTISYIDTLVVDPNTGYVYAGGFFDTAGGAPANNVAYWNGSTWVALGQGIGSGPNDTFSEVYAMALYNGNLYVGGKFNLVNGNTTAYNLAEWTGSTWIAVGEGLGNGPGDFTSAVYSLIVYNGNLYAGGFFSASGGNPDINVAELVSNSWIYLNSGIGGGVGDDSSFVGAMAVYNNELFVGGYFNLADDTAAYNIAYWQNLEGINNVTVKGEARVYPNPNTGLLNVSMNNVTEDADFQLYNELGAKVYNSQIVPGNTVIDINNKAAGTYFYRITAKDGSAVSSGEFILL